jgi:predicted nucleotide-binding protein
MLPIDSEAVKDLLRKGRIQEAALAIRKLPLWQAHEPLSELIKLQRSIDATSIERTESLREQIARFVNLLERAPAMTEKAKPHAFIVHGWDNELKLDTKNYFEGVLRINCIILHEQSSDGDVIINKFENHASRASIALVLLSEKDETSNRLEDPNASRRPRPNVLFELGYFFAKLGRRNVLLLKRGNVEINSNILGVEFIDVTNGVASAGEIIRTRLGWMLTQSSSA